MTNYSALAYVISSRYRQIALKQLGENPKTPKDIAEDGGFGQIGHASRAITELSEEGLVELLVREDIKRAASTVSQTRAKKSLSPSASGKSNEGSCHDGPDGRLEEAAKQVGIARETIDRPDQDAALARAEYLIRGVADTMEDPDDIDPSILADGGRKLPLPTQEIDRTFRARKDLPQTHLSQEGWSR